MNYMRDNTGWQDDIHCTENSCTFCTPNMSVAKEIKNVINRSIDTWLEFLSKFKECNNLDLHKTFLRDLAFARRWIIFNEYPPPDVHVTNTWCIECCWLRYDVNSTFQDQDRTCSFYNSNTEVFYNFSYYS